MKRAHVPSKIEANCIVLIRSARAAGVAMGFKLIESAQARWRTVNAPHLVALVGAGAKFERGQLVEPPDGSGGDLQVALPRRSTDHRRV